MKITNILLLSTLLIGLNSALFAEISHDHSNNQAINNQATNNQTAITDTESNHTEKLIHAQGEVKAIDLNTHKVTIMHEPISELNWPAMTMRFTAENNSLIFMLKAGDKVDFTFFQKGNLSQLTSINQVQ